MAVEADVGEVELCLCKNCYDNLGYEKVKVLDYFENFENELESEM